MLFDIMPVQVGQCACCCLLHTPEACVCCIPACPACIAAAIVPSLSIMLVFVLYHGLLHLHAL
jgi:hypothetical protein